MKAFLLTIHLFFLISIHSIFAQKTVDLYINPQDCHNCNVKLQNIFQNYSNSNNSFNIYLSKNYESDSIFIKEQLAINTPNHITYNYNLSNNNFRSYYKIIANNETIDSNLILNYNGKVIKNYCLESSYAAYSDYKIEDDMITIKDIGFSRMVLYRNFKKEVELTLEDINALEANYKSYYKDDYSKPLSTLLEYKKIMSNLNLQLKYTSFHNNKLYFTNSAPIFTPHSNQKDTLVSTPIFFNEYDLKTKKIKSYYLNTQEKPFYISSDFYLEGDNLLIGVTPIDKHNYSDRIIAVYRFKDNNYQFKELLNITLPKNYIDNKIFYNFLTPKFNEGYVSHSYSNELIDLHDNNKKISLLISDEDINSTINLDAKFFNIANETFYRLLDFKIIENKFVRFIYFDKDNNLFEKQIELKTNKEIYNKLLKPNLKNNNLQLLPKYYKDNIIYKYSDQQCFEII